MKITRRQLRRIILEAVGNITPEAWADQYGLDVDVDNDGVMEIFAGTSGDLIAIDYKDETVGNFDSWSIFKGDWTRSGYYLADDSSEGGCNNPELGDINCDQINNVIDVISMMNMILGDSSLYTDYELWSADLNGDDVVDVFDIITIVNIILDS